MNPELLKYYVALQPFFRERMGEWKPHDKLLYPTGEIVYYTVWDGGKRWVPTSGDIVWIPLTIDDSSEEARNRSLWGMVDWKMFKCDSPQWLSGDIKIYQWNEEVGLFSDKVCSWCSPTEAILKALCVQWEVEV
jgi:hypothetical protein